MKILWKYYISISQLEFFIFYIIFPFSISLSTIRFISFSFFFSFFSPPHTVHYLYPSFTLLFSLILPHSSKRSRSSFFLQLPLSFFFFNFLLDSKTLSVIRKFSFSPSFKNIPGSSHLRAVAHLRPQPSPDGLVGFCPLSFFSFFFFFFAFIVMIWLILKLCFWVCILVIWLCLSLEMFERKIVYCYDL